MPDRSNDISLDDIIARDRRARASEVASATLGKARTQVSGDILSAKTPRGGVVGGKRSGASGSGMSSGSGANGKWTHDLHRKVNPNASRVSKLPTTLSPAIARSLQNNRLFAALHGTANTSTTPFSPISASMNTPPPGLRSKNNGGSDGLSIRGASSTSPAGFSIRGSAGPFVVQAANFAPGTTAEDVKMAMRDLGRILSCIVLSPTPSVTCEIVFEKKDAADNCIAQFHNQLADGRRLSLALKEGPPISRLMQSQNSTLGNSSARLNSPSSSYANPNAAREEADRQRRQANVSFQDGSYGVRPPPLYSDALVQKGRGFSSR
ncbi:unnamed protein product [Tuber aestivum]|uniref:RRM domain-containing protein n=1 Tax=Tuber aestivum TaxID=59557 RepID=A0A292PTJ6_9PEZI|nr:unnamed protein product [Tuber aestivum]